MKENEKKRINVCQPSISAYKLRNMSEAGVKKSLAAPSEP